ncbi:hypothetical protein Nepgr_030034 [Nepenthes gracilis]|uniref:Uncharacterized protein n=1 Tax=Nepenthes gracilis TaxID=150966 RepID=A0AAD3TG17_NEPGR|nr:hypothetical protein Nepgr_030034 [Nepenthes gracilis]
MIFKYLDSLKRTRNFAIEVAFVEAIWYGGSTKIPTMVVSPPSSRMRRDHMPGLLLILDWLMHYFGAHFGDLVAILGPGEAGWWPRDATHGWRRWGKAGCNGKMADETLAQLEVKRKATAVHAFSAPGPSVTSSNSFVVLQEADDMYPSHGAVSISRSAELMVGDQTLTH